MVATPSKRPRKGTCCAVALGPASPSTVKTASARLAAKLWRFMVSLLLVCATWLDIVPGAQTERRGGAGPVRGLLAVRASPAAFLCLHFSPARPHEIRTERAGACLGDILNAGQRRATRRRLPSAHRP